MFYEGLIQSKPTGRAESSSVLSAKLVIMAAMAADITMAKMIPLAVLGCSFIGRT